MLLEKIEGLLKEVSTVTAQSAEDVERLRLKYLSKKGEINALMGEFRNVAADQKRAVGIKINELKQLAQSRINALKEQVEDQAAQSDDIDLTRTPYPVTLGTRHPLTLVKNEIIDIFSRMGFTLYSGPEIDDDQHVFTMLNFAADHPARDMQDTFFIDRSDPSDVTKNVLLRSHTSGDPRAPHPYSLPGPRLSQRGHLGPCPLLLPPGGGPVCGQGRELHRPEAGAAHLCP